MISSLFSAPPVPPPLPDGLVQKQKKCKLFPFEQNPQSFFSRQDLISPTPSLLFDIISDEDSLSDDNSGVEFDDTRVVSKRNKIYLSSIFSRTPHDSSSTKERQITIADTSSLTNGKNEQLSVISPRSSGV